MNVTSNAAVGYSVATTSSESLLNDCEKPNQPKKLLFLICDLIWLNFREVCIQFSGTQGALSRSGIHKSILEG